MAKESGVLNRLLKLTRPSGGADCCGVEIVEDTDDTSEGLTDDRRD